MNEHSKVHPPLREGLHNDFSEQEGSMERSAMPPPLQLQASSTEEDAQSGGEDSLLWLLKFTWESGDKPRFWRLVEDKQEQILHDPASLRWLREMNAKDAFAQEANTIPQPLLEMSIEPQDHTGTQVPEPKLLELPEVVITAQSLAPPERPYWRLLHRDKGTDYHFAQRGTTFFIVAETAINSGGSAYHYLTFDRPQEWKEFFPRDRNFNAELKEAVDANMQLLQFAELVAEEGVWMIFGAATEMIEFGRLVALAGAGRKAAREGMEEGAELAARKGAKGSVEEIAEHTPLPPKAESTEATAREAAEAGLGESAEAVTHSLGRKGAVGPERATRMRTRMLGKVGGDMARGIRFSDAELAEFMEHAEQLGFGEGDMEAILSVKVRKPWVKLEGLKDVATSLAQKSRNHQIAFKEGWDFMKAYREAQERMLKNRPMVSTNARLSGWQEELDYLDPSEYLEDWYIREHLKPFEGMSSYLVTGKNFNRFVEGADEIGYQDGQYLSTKAEIDRVLNQANGDVSIIEKELGITSGAWQNQDGIYRIDVFFPESLELRIPNGKEIGANEFWHPGGFTSGGAREAFVNRIPRGNFKWERIIP